MNADTERNASSTGTFLALVSMAFALFLFWADGIDRADGAPSLPRGVRTLLVPGTVTGNPVPVGQSDVTAVAVGDFDADGRADIVTGSYSGDLTLWRNPDGGPFTPNWPHVTSATGYLIRSLALADIDRDGHLDLVVGYAYPGRLVVMQNPLPVDPMTTGWASFNLASLPNDDFASTFPTSIAVADLDGDSYPDIVAGAGSEFDLTVTAPVTRSTNFAVYAYRNSTNPFVDAWTNVTVSVTLDAVNAVSVGDLNGDGLPDIVVGTNHAPAIPSGNPTPWPNTFELRAFRNPGGASTFGAAWPVGVDIGRDPETYTNQCIADSQGCPYHGFYGASTLAVTLADLDGVNGVDIISGDAWYADHQVKVWRNPGTATAFSGSPWYFSAVGQGSGGSTRPWLDYADTRSLAAGDVNHDGVVDVVSGHQFGQVMYWQNSGNPFGIAPPATNWTAHNLGNIGYGVTAVTGVAATGLVQTPTGFPDVIAGSRYTTQSGSPGQSSVYVWQNDNGAFDNPAPALTQISPSSSIVGGPGFTLNVTGTNLATSSVVRWNGTALTTSFVSTSRLSATVATANLNAAGAVSVTIQTPLPGGGTSNALTLQVDKGGTTTTLTGQSADTSYVGEAVTVGFTVTVNAPSSGSATGTVTVSDGVSSCTATLPATSCTWVPATAGNRALTASYAGDGNYNPSQSGQLAHTVLRADTTTGLTTSASPTVYGQVVTFTAQITSSFGTPAGAVTFKDGSSTITGCTSVPVSSGVARCSTTSLTVAAHTIAAEYDGGAGHNPSTGTGSQTVGKAATTTTITQHLPNPSVRGQAVTVGLTVTVTFPGSGAPTGTITVSDGVGNCVATLPTQTCKITLASVGAKTLTATYSGDGNLTGSSTSVAHAVQNGYFLPYVARR